MIKKNSNLISIIPAFLLIGIAIGVQLKNIIVHTAIGLFIGIVIYFFLSNRNKTNNNNK
jgi:hypothetical protein